VTAGPQTPPPSRTTGRVARVADLTPHARAEMFALLDAHFTDADRDVFERDLADKDVAILLENDEGAVVGFSTIVARHIEGPAGDALVVYSGDTIVEHAHRGSATLERLGAQCILASAESSGSPAYWLLLCSGFRTYRFLPLLFRDFFPKAGGSADPALAAHADAFAKALFGDARDADSGIVRVDGASTLADDLAEPDERHLRNEHVRFFLEANPGHRVGDELVCLARLERANLTEAAFRMRGSG
jgi:hypothetical protein